MRVLSLLLISLLALVTLETKGQCVVINEIMINPTGSFDGNQNGPQTSEWIELYNTCSTPVDMSCWVLGTEYYTVTIPSGTIIQPGDFFTLGTSNSGFAVDLDIVTCGCGNPYPAVNNNTNFGVLNNSHGYVVLTNNTGQVMDGLWWGPAAGFFPFTFTSANQGSCGSLSVTIPNPAALPNSTSLYTAGSGTNGSAWGRPCDGIPGFASIAVGAETPSAPNSVPPPPTPLLSASATTVCPGECITFTSSNPTAGLVFSWNLPGGTPSFFSGPTPPPICYNSPGNYTVILVLSNPCGNSTLTLSNYITVVPPTVPVISALGPLSICPGSTTNLQVTGGAGPFQWLLNGVALAGETGNTLTVTNPGIYTVQSGTGSCLVSSNPIVITQPVLTPPTVALGGPSAICSGSSAMLSVVSGPGNVQWMEGGVAITGETGTTLSINQAGNYSVVLTNNGCTAQSNSISITTLTVPTPTIQSGSTVICGAGPLAIQTNSGQGSYQWQLNGSDIAGATSSAYNATLAGTYTVVVTNAAACSATASITLTQLPFQSPTVSPSGNQSFCAGSSLTLNANATSGSTFQWTLNGIALPGGNTSSFSATQAGTYAVTVVLGSCSAATANVQVTVNSPPSPVINQVGPLTICPGQNQVLSLSQSFSSYQWLLNGSPIAGQTLGSLSVTTSGTYGVLVTNWSGCTATANGPVVNVSTLTPPVISGAPANALCSGQSASLSAPPGLSTYQWFYNGSAVAGATTANLVVSQAGSYSVSVSDALGCSLSSSNVSIQVSNPTPGVWISGPTSFCNGGSVTLTSQNPNASYVWLESGVAVPGGSASSLVVTQTGTYTVQVVVGGCSVTSAPISVSVYGAVPPTITANPGLALCPGSTVTMSAGGTFSQLQWLLNGAPIAGANNANLSVTSSGTYSVVGTQSFTWNTTPFNCIATSVDAVVTNGQVPTPTLAGPNPLVLCAATSTPIAVTGTFATCQWLLNGALVPGATSPTYNASTAGSYTVVAVSADGCTAVSNPLTVQVLPAVVVSLSNQGQSSFCQGGQTQLQAAAGYVTYQWLQNGAPLISSASNQLSVNSSGSYSVVATDGNGCSGISPQQNVTVWPLPNPSIASANGLSEVCPGDSILLQTPQTFNAYQWSQGAALSPGNVQQQWASTPGIVTLQVTDANGCSATTTATVTAAPVPTPVVTAPANGLCAGQVLVLSTGVFSSYEWFLNNTTVSTGNATMIASEVGNYSVRVENAQGCADTSSVFQVFPSAIPPPPITISNPQPCAGEPVLLTATSTDGSIAWSTGQSGGQLVVFAPGIYTATVTAPNGCKSDSTFSVVYKPKPIITMGPDQTVFCDRAVEIDARAQGTYTWTPTTGLSSATELSTRVLPEVTTRYVLTATLNGCTHSDSVLISVEACETLWIPNSFSPNSDGRNEVFKAIGNDIGVYSLEIYDRWGQRIFSTSDPEQGWDGTINGEKAPSGVYVWRIEVYNTQGKRMRSGRGDVGTISLLR